LGENVDLAIPAQYRKIVYSPRSSPLDRPDAGESGRNELAVGATHSGGSPTRAAPHPDIQIVEGPGVCREAQGHRRSHWRIWQLKLRWRFKGVVSAIGEKAFV
jgi:hypothetical protein